MRDRVPVPSSKQPPPRIQIERLEPQLDCGRYAPKRSVGDDVVVQADIFRDGHETLRAVVKSRGPGEKAWSEAPMHRIDAHVDGDRWEGRFTVQGLGTWRFTVEAWADPFASWRDEVARKVNAAQEDLSGELSEGVVLLEAALKRAKDKADKSHIEAGLAVIGETSNPQDERVAAALDTDLADAIERWPDRSDSAEAGPFEVLGDPPLARFSSWYELFPRSWGGFKGVEKQVPAIAELGFDVLYLPPIHPIGVKNRKGRNNAVVAEKGDPGSPWAIGSKQGGHDAINPELGTLKDFDALVSTAEKHGIAIALDLAIQCSADHPWLTEHPEWFNHRPDGTLKYAENPPKRYQDIYNVNFDSEDWRGLWQALLEVTLHWVEHGVKVFRVDNPHTKPLPFWEWLIGEVRKEHPDVIFLAEAFTRGAMMRTLAKIGFNQSYTYFTWKNSRWELTEYVLELAYSGMQEYYRPNFFANTPDILHAYLQHGGWPAFEARLVLAATLSPSYGIYSGFEHGENVPVREGSEEYLDSEKYEAKERRLDGPLLPMVQAINRARRENPALQRLDNVTFLDSASDALIAYAKRTGTNTVVTVVNLDPEHVEEGLVTIPASLGLPPAFGAEDLVTGDFYDWRIGGNYVRLEPGQSHVARCA
jgi:starch synthase (maltosyl-transferring)